jgi:hypothetical protein
MATDIINWYFTPVHFKLCGDIKQYNGYAFSENIPVKKLEPHDDGESWVFYTKRGGEITKMRIAISNMDVYFSTKHGKKIINYINGLYQ